MGDLSLRTQYYRTDPSLHPNNFNYSAFLFKNKLMKLQRNLKKKKFTFFQYSPSRLYDI